MNSKKIATVSNGYTVTKMSIAVVVNQQRLTAILGETATPEQIAARVADIQKLVASATGFNETRGDVINVSAVEFIDGLDGGADRGARHDGLDRPACRHDDQRRVLHRRRLPGRLLRPAARWLQRSASRAPALAGPSFDDVAAFAAQVRKPPIRPATPDRPRPALAGPRGGATPLDDLRQKLRPAPQDRLARMVDLNEERTAQILRKWAHQEAALMAAVDLFDVLQDFGAARAAVASSMPAELPPAPATQQPPEWPQHDPDEALRAAVARGRSGGRGAPDAGSRCRDRRAEARAHATEMEALLPALRRAGRRDDCARIAEMEARIGDHVVGGRGAHPRRLSQRRTLQKRSIESLADRSAPRSPTGRQSASRFTARSRCS